jgi:hypothetical protein
MTSRRLAVLIAVAVPLALAGCGGADSCPTEVAKVSSVPASCTLATNANVVVTLPLCAACNQSAPSCVVVPPNASGDIAFQLDTTAQACTDSSSCGLPGSCLVPAPRVTCTFRTPAQPGPYEFVIVDPSGTARAVPFTVSAAGGTSCSGSG